MTAWKTSNTEGDLCNDPEMMLTQCELGVRVRVRDNGRRHGRSMELGIF